MCTRCLFEFTKHQSQALPGPMPSAAPSQLPKFTVEESYSSKSPAEPVNMSRKPGKFDYPEGSSLEEEVKASPDVGIVCEQHNRPATQLCFCGGQRKTYLCEACLNSHIAVIGPRHDLLPAFADVNRPEEIYVYRHKERLLVKTKEIIAKLNQEKQEFDETLSQTLEYLKSLIDEIFTEITSAALAEFDTFEASLQLIQSELENWHYSPQSFSKETRLFAHYAEITSDDFHFFDFATDLSSRISISRKEGRDLRSLESLIAALGTMCLCDNCEELRTALGLPSARPWTCAQCHSTRKLEKSCGECGCGPSVLDLLMYREVEIRDNGTKWVCQNCKAINSTETKDCGKCQGEAGKHKSKFLGLLPFRSYRGVCSLHSQHRKGNFRLLPY